MLPNKNDGFFGLWESLVYDDNLKENLLDFSETMLLFSNMKIDQNIVSCNRLILLHGLPGTGKTSLAKALAQKLSIHMSDSYQFTHLFEINSHSLFSKWFSESGKLVMKMFQQIQEVIEMESSLVCVLIDEVESIAFARGNISTNEPSDSVRVVNSVLTQLDRIKKYPNVLIITTSNLTASIDLAFLDRADIVLNIGQPSIDAIYKIISSSITELASKGIIISDNPEDGRDDFNVDSISSYERFIDLQKFPPFSTGNILAQVCKEANGLSGRGLRKLPFLAHALFLKKSSATLREFLIAMRSAVAYQKRSKESIGQFNKHVEGNGDKLEG
jgi:pachytene checkpoint protein 2